MITPRELRSALFYIRNQEMTVRELRSLLYEQENQDEKRDQNQPGVWEDIDSLYELRKEKRKAVQA